MNACACGCGTLVRKQWVQGHHLRGKRLVGYSGRTLTVKGYVLVRDSEHPNAYSSGYVREHTLVAGRAMGKPLPPAAVVHHVNGVKADNRPQNLVICQDNAYHQLVHQRTRALRGCGHADWRKCEICGNWDDPSNLAIYKNGARHRRCARARYHRQKKATA